MADVEKVIKALETCRKTDCANCEYNTEVCLIDEMISDAIALLKEQQQQIWEFQDQVEYLTDKQKEQKFLVDSDGKITPLPVVVRCKDCKYRPELKLYSDKRGNFKAVKFPEGSKCPCQCEDFFYSWYPSDDWFCANGKPKEENDGKDMASW